ncbi:MAG: hypothetical protein IPF57_01795 [Gammaproteobacteria bacterium]|jgi:hypothetical protein|nr:hypothetical protein [Gammaproteobacteria bacterium]
MPLRPSALAALASLILLAACGPSASSPDGAAQPADALHGRVAAHWFGRQWPKNYLSGFRREHVAEDFRALAQDGFDTVVLLVAWGDFQPVYAPCCVYDERAFERLRFLLDRADEAGLGVILRLGYGWSFHPQAGDVGERQHRVLNDPAARAAFVSFLERVSAEISGHDNVLMGFMSWEDLWLRQVDEAGADTYAEYLATLAPDPARPTGLPDATRDARLFHGYWDWLVIEKLLEPAAPLFPALSFEARIDSEPRLEPGPDGAPVVAEWITHDGMMRMPQGHPLTIYWAPFWGALNRGEQLPAARSLELLDALLRQSAEKSGRPLFIDQFNFVDNTPGHEHNAVIRPEEIPAFLHDAVCTMKRHDVLGYAIWTARDYAESPLHNPVFGYGLEGWRLERVAGAPEQALQVLPSGDFQLRLADGDRLSQQVPHRHGRMPRPGDALPDRVCVEADVAAPGTLEARAGGEPVMLAFEAPGRQRRCADIAPRPDDEGLTFSVQLRGGVLALREVMIFDHVQYGGLYDLEGRPGPLREPVRRMNRDFRSEPARCADPRFAGLRSP